MPVNCFGVVRDANSFCQMPPPRAIIERNQSGEKCIKNFCAKGLRVTDGLSREHMDFVRQQGKKYIRSCCGKVGATPVWVTSEGEEAAECFKTYHVFSLTVI